jgi:hypothetical protein
MANCFKSLTLISIGNFTDSDLTTFPTIHGQIKSSHYFQSLSLLFAGHILFIESPIGSKCRTNEIVIKKQLPYGLENHNNDFKYTRFVCYFLWDFFLWFTGNNFTCCVILCHKNSTLFFKLLFWFQK